MAKITRKGPTVDALKRDRGPDERVLPVEFVDDVDRRGVVQTALRVDEHAVADLVPLCFLLLVVISYLAAPGDGGDLAGEAQHAAARVAEPLRTAAHRTHPGR